MARYIRIHHLECGLSVPKFSTMDVVPFIFLVVKGAQSLPPTVLPLVPDWLICLPLVA